MKKITIEGNSNIKKVIPEQYDSTRKDIKKNEIDDKLLEHNKQIEIINKLYLNDVSNNEKMVTKFIKSKLNSYKQQDIKNNIYGEKFFIKEDKVIEMLVKCKLRCFYCSNEIFLIYKEIKNKYQWTLDRINNDMGHNNDNVVISCLDCNLKRRNQNINKFLFTKKLNIIKN
tara:strand:+ start:1885 stop:2397 length:513 start_codon:yes stop_codon:yes gene_type:complete